MDKPLKLCKASGCPNLTREKYCEEHRYLQEEEDRKRMEYLRKNHKSERKSSYQRGYDAKWQNYSKWFLRQPGHQLCALHLDDKCAIVAECVDHIMPPKDKHDPLFWDMRNHQPSCIHCNSVKGHRYIKGKERM